MGSALVTENPRPVVPYVSLLEGVDIQASLTAILAELVKLNTQTEAFADNIDKTVNRLDLILLDTTEIAAGVAGMAIELAAIAVDTTAIAIDTTAIAATEVDIAANTTGILAATIALEGTTASILGIETNIKSDTGALVTSASVLETNTATLILTSNKIEQSTRETDSNTKSILELNSFMYPEIAATSTATQHISTRVDQSVELLVDLKAQGTLQVSYLSQIKTDIDHLDDTVDHIKTALDNIHLDTAAIRSGTNVLVNNTNQLVLDSSALGTIVAHIGMDTTAILADTELTTHILADTLSATNAIYTKLSAVYEDVETPHPCFVVYPLPI